MSQHYCHSCALKRSLLGSGVTANANLTGSSYQLDKYIKHSIPPASPPQNPISVFNEPSYQVYKNYIVNTMASGSVEIDARGRLNIVWLAGRDTGVTYIRGSLEIPVDAVKVVCYNNEYKIHGYPTGSMQLLQQSCDDCGDPIFK